MRNKPHFPKSGHKLCHKNGYAPILKEINELIENGTIEVEGKSVELNIYLGGDYKVQQLYIHVNLYN